MAYLIAILVPAIALAAFLLLVRIEAHSGRRLFPATRYKLDTRVSRAALIIQHVDWGAFTADITRASLERLAHDAAHGTLILVRALERALTRAVRALRIRRGAVALPSASEVPEGISKASAAITYLKHSVRRSRRRRMDIDTK